MLVKVDNMLMTSTFARTLRLKVCPESYGWLSAAAVEVNTVFNYANETSWHAATRTDLKRKWFTGYDLCNLTSGSARYFERIGADTLQCICVEYAQKQLHLPGLGGHRARGAPDRRTSWAVGCVH